MFLAASEHKNKRKENGKMRTCQLWADAGVQCKHLDCKILCLAFEVMEINYVITLLYKSAYNMHEHEKVGPLSTNKIKFNRPHIYIFMTIHITGYMACVTELFTPNNWAISHSSGIQQDSQFMV